MKKLLFISLLLPCFVFGQVAYVPAGLTLGESGKEFHLKAELFSPTGTVNNEGESFSFASGTSHQRMDIEFKFAFGFTKRFEGFFGLKGRQVASKYIDENDEAQVSNVSGAESAFFGFNYSFPIEDSIQYTIHTYYGHPLFANKYLDSGETSEDVALGDDGRRILVGGSLYHLSKSNNFFSSQLLYRSPSDTLSSEFLTRFEYVLGWRYIALGLSYEYLYSMKGDAYTNDPENKPGLFQGVSGEFNSINRSWTAPGVIINIALGKLWRLETNIEQVISGTSTDLGPKISLALVRRNSGESTYKKKNESFKEYTIEGIVKKISSSNRVVVIDKGISSGLKKGDQVDFYHFDYIGGNELIASGRVVKTQASKSLVKIIKRFSKKRVEEGTVARSGEIR